MTIADIAIKRPISIIMLALSIAVIGIFTFPMLGLDLLPKLEYPVVSVITTYEGVASEDIENLITKPIEGGVSAVKDVKKVTSKTTEGLSVVNVEFEWGTNIDFAAEDIREMIAQVEEYLPEDAADPLIMKFDLSQMPVLYYGITSENLSSLELRKWVEDNLKDKFRRIEGVADVRIEGGQEREIQVLIDKEKMESVNLSFDQVEQILRYENLNISGGHVEKGIKEFGIRTKGEFKSLDEIKNTVISVTVKGIPIYLKEIAEVKHTHKEIRGYAKVQDEEAVFIAVKKESGANTAIVVKNVKNKIPEFEKTFPPNTQIHLVMDQSELIINVINAISKSAIWGGILAILMIFLFLRNWRPSIVIAFTIPLSILLTFAGLVVGGYTFNMMTLAAIALGVGMLVDNAVVVIENIFRRMEQEHEDRFTASAKGTNQVVLAITASTFTTIIVFLPMSLTAGITGRLVRPLAFTITFALLASLLMAVTFVPMMASKLFKKNEGGLKMRQMGKVMRYVTNVYEKILHFVLKNRLKTILTVILVLIFSLLLLTQIGSEFIPKQDQTMMLVQITMPRGTRLKETAKVAEEVKNIIEREEGIKNISVAVGAAGGSKQEAQILGEIGVHTAQIFINLVDKKDRSKKSYEIEDIIRKKFPDIKGSTVKFTDITTVIMGRMSSDIEIKLFGKDLDVLKNLSDEIKNKLAKIEGIGDIRSSFKETNPEVHIIPDREKSALYGLTAGYVGQSLKTAYEGKVITRYRKQGDETDIRVKLRDVDKKNIESIRGFSVKSPMGSQISLKQIAKVTFGEGFAEIDREDQARKGTISAKVIERDLGSVVSDIQNELKDLNLPSGYSLEYGGQYKDMRETFTNLFYALLASALLIYMIMASQFESLIHPFTVIFSIPLGIIGVIWGLFLTGNTLSLTSYMGLVMMSGIVVNNAIVLITFVNQLKEKGLSRYDALVEAGKTRLRPILITSLTTIFGMLPMATSQEIGADAQRPMAIAVIGGLVVATFLTLLIIPVVYDIFDNMAEKVNIRINKLLHE